MSGTTTTKEPAPEVLWSPQTVIALVVLAIVAATVAGVFVKGDGPIIDTISGLVIGTGLGGVCGFFFGSSTGSQKKDAALAAAAVAPPGSAMAP